ncbi:MAG TPA: hypothetical protein VGE57_05380 [Solimonas sp.]
MNPQQWRWVRAVAVFDLIVTASLAIPVASEYVMAWLLSGFGFAGAASDWLPLPLTTALFLNLAGLLGVLWNGYRVLNPEPLLVRMDQWGRIVVAAVLAWYLLARGAPVVLWLFVASELAGSIIEWRALRRG